MYNNKNKPKLNVRFNFVMTEEDRHLLYLLWRRANKHQPTCLHTVGAVIRKLIREEVARQMIDKEKT
jgi:hypothetical protein